MPTLFICQQVLLQTGPQDISQFTIQHLICSVFYAFSRPSAEKKMSKVFVFAFFTEGLLPILVHYEHFQSFPTKSAKM